MKIKFQLLNFMLLISILMLGSACGNSEKTLDYISIGEESVPADTQEINLAGRGITDILPLLKLENLNKLDIRNNPITEEQVISFKKDRPQCEILWTININGASYDSNSDTIDFIDSGVMNADEIIEKISYFDNLKSVIISSQQISPGEYKIIKEMYPDIEFDLDILVCGIWFDRYDTQLDLRTCENIDQNKLLETLPYFDSVDFVDLTGALGPYLLSNELMNMYPDTVFRWDVVLGGNVYSSDVEEIDFSGNVVTDLDLFKTQISYFTNLNLIDMCDCGLDNGKMEELTLQFSGTKFVWKIRVAAWEIRTDTKAFGTCQRKTFPNGEFYLEDKDAALLKYCTDLETLDIGHQFGIHDFSFLKGLTKMKHLILSLTYFSDMSLLREMKDLEFLEIFDSHVENLSSITELENLKYLNISSTLITSVDYLVDMNGLEWIWLCSPRFVSREELDRLKESLPECRIETDIGGATRGAWRSYENEGYIQMREALGVPPTINEE